MTIPLSNTTCKLAVVYRTHTNFNCSAGGGSVPVAGASVTNVIFKLAPSSSIANLGPITTFTYTITNPQLPPIRTHITGLSIASGAVNLVIGDLTPARTHHVLRCQDLRDPQWTTSHTFTAISVQTNWDDSVGNETGAVFYRIDSE